MTSIALTAAFPILAAQPAQSLDPILACVDTADDTARLQCYDRAAAAARALVAASPAAVRTTPAPSVPATPPVANAPATPSASVPMLGEEQLRGRKQPDTVSTMLQARITESRGAGGGRYMIFLDNGQVWSHEMPSMAPYLLTGKAVTIRKASLGSYRLTLDDGKSKDWVRVTRVR